MYLRTAVKEAYIRDDNNKMMPGQVEFTYSADDLNALLLYLSPERLAMYMKAVQYAKDLTDRTRKALKRYEYNTQLSQALYPVIQGFEVTLRNAIHNRLSVDHGVEWLDTFQMLESERASVNEARETIRKKPQIVTQDRVVAELNLGFWVRLFSAEYAETLWGPSLSKIVKSNDRRNLYEQLKEIKTLRNRIAHHNRIIGRSPTVEESYRHLLEVLDGISPIACAWVIKTSNFEELIKKQTPIAPIRPKGEVT
jgi:hypothetical protein